MSDLLSHVRSAVHEHDVVDLIEVLSSKPSPWGAERAVAHLAAAWIADRAEHMAVAVDDFATASANVRAIAGDASQGLMVYSHLDTSLRGDPSDEPITGIDSAPADLRRYGRTLIGPGLGVARVPAAAAAIGAIVATRAMADAGIPYRCTLLLAGCGTHHRDAVWRHSGTAAFGIGVRRALAQDGLPMAALVAKSGPSYVLHGEPGSAYVDLVMRGEMLPAFMRAARPPGLVEHLPAVLTAVDQWCTSFGHRPRLGQIGRAAAVGAIRAGSPDKCDLLPAVIRIGVYLVLGHGDDANALADELQRVAADAADADGIVSLESHVAAWEPAGSTAQDSGIVVAARAASGANGGIHGWCGSTDGTVFRTLGVPTARWGPTITPDESDPRLDRVDIDTAVGAAQVYAHTIVGFMLGRRDEGRSPG